MDRHRHEKKSNRNQKITIDHFFSSRIFIIFGAIFVAVGLYYSMSSSGGIDTLYNWWQSLFSPSDTVQQNTITSNAAGFAIALGCFLPAVVVLAVSLFFSRKYTSFAYSLSLIIAVYMLVVQVKLFSNFAVAGYLYYFPSFFIATVFLFVTTFLLLFAVFIYRKFTLVLLSGLYFYITIVLYASSYHIVYDILFVFVVLFSGSMVWLERKIKRPEINLFNFFFALAFFSLFIVRKFFVNSNPEFLIVFFIFSWLFYLLFYFIAVVSANREEKPLPKLLQLLFVWGNLLFFLGATAFILLKYYMYVHLCLFVPALLLVNLAGLFLVRRHAPAVWLLPYAYIVLLLAALLLPLWVGQSRLFLCAAGFSIVMLVYSMGVKEKTAMWLSVVSLVVAIGCYLYGWLSGYLPFLLFPAQTMLHPSLVWEGAIGSVVIVALLWGTKQLLQGGELPSSVVLKQVRYLRFVEACWFSALFLALGWGVFTLIYSVTGTVLYTPESGFIAGSLFFILLILCFSGKRSPFKKPAHYFGFLFAMLYPLFTGLNFMDENLVKSEVLDGTAVWMHYIALVLLVVLAVIAIGRLRKRNAKNPLVRQIIHLLLVAYLVFILFMEYDNLTMITTLLGSTSHSAYITGMNQLNANSYLPDTIMLGILAVAICVYGILKQKLFFKSCAFALIVLALIKLFALDFEIVSPKDQGTVFLGVGIYLVGFALLYTRLAKQVANKEEIQK